MLYTMDGNVKVVGPAPKKGKRCHFCRNKEQKHRVRFEKLSHYCFPGASTQPIDCEALICQRCLYKHQLKKADLVTMSGIDLDLALLESKARGL